MVDSIDSPQGDQVDRTAAVTATSTEAPTRTVDGDGLTAHLRVCSGTGRVRRGRTVAGGGGPDAADRGTGPHPSGRDARHAGDP